MKDGPHHLNRYRGHLPESRRTGTRPGKESVTETARVLLPRFKLEFGTNEPYSMKQVLKRMGLTSAFDQSKSWQFEKMSNQDLYVDDIVHGAAMEVNLCVNATPVQ